MAVSSSVESRAYALCFWSKLMLNIHTKNQHRCCDVVSYMQCIKHFIILCMHRWAGTQQLMLSVQLISTHYYRKLCMPDQILYYKGQYIQHARLHCFCCTLSHIYRACKAGAASRIDNACIVTRHALDSGLRSVSKINYHTHWMPLIHVSLRYKWHAWQNGGVPNTTLYIIYVMDILLTQCCWCGVVFSEKAFQHSGNPTQQWKLSTEVSRSFLTETWEVAICKWNQWDQRIRFFLRPENPFFFWDRIRNCSFELKVVILHIRGV